MTDMNLTWLMAGTARLAQVPMKEVVMVWSDRDKRFGNATFETVLASLADPRIGISHWCRVTNPHGTRIVDNG